MSDRYWLWHDINDRSCIYYVTDRHVSSIGDSDPRNVVAVCTDDQQAQRIVDLLNTDEGMRTTHTPRLGPISADGYYPIENVPGFIRIKPAVVK